MKTTQDLADLAQITQAKYAQRQQNLARLNAEEKRIRDALARLSDMDKSNRTTAPDVIPMRAIGADVLWHGWMGRSKSALNMELARVLAVKEHHVAEVRRAYGKVLVVDELRDQQRADRRKDTQKAQLERAINQSLWQ